MGLLDNQTAIIFGGSGMIGSAACRLLARHGAHTVVHFNRNRKTAQHIVSQIKDAGGSAIALQADVTDSRSIGPFIDEVVALYGSIHIAVDTVRSHIASYGPIGLRTRGSSDQNKRENRYCNRKRYFFHG